MKMTEAFKFPLKFYSSWVMDSNHHKVFDFCLPFLHQGGWKMSNETMERIVKILNGEEFPTQVNEFREEEGIIYFMDRPFICIRAWGYLTGIGGLNLMPKEALEIQKEVSDFIIKKLSK